MLDIVSIYIVIRTIKMMKFFSKYLKNCKLEECIIFILMLANSFLSIFLSQIMANLIDGLSIGAWSGMLLKTVIAYIIVSVLQQVLLGLQSILYVQVDQKITISVKKDIISSLFDKDGEFFSKVQSGDIMEVINGDSNVIAELLTATFLTTISNVITAIAMIVYLAILQWDLLLIIIVLQLLIIPIQALFGNKIYKLSSKYRELYGNNVSQSQEFLANATRFIGGGLKPFFNKKYNKSLDNIFKADIKLTTTTTINSSLVNLLSVLVFVAIIGIGGYKVTVGAITMGILIVFIQNSQRLIEPLFQLVNLKIELDKSMPSIERVEELANLPKEKTNGKKCEHINNITMRSIDFAYDENNKILQNFNASFESGNLYVIKGRSGIGKTTFCNLLLRLWKIENGKILINENNIYDLDVDSLRKRITFVPQEDFVLNTSLYENIVLDSIGVSYEDVKEALRFAQLDDFIDNEKLNELAGESGVNISGGQRQRLAIARAFIRDSSVIIFDEPTSALDRENESKIIENLKRLSKNKIIIVISHSQNVIESGEIVYDFEQLNNKTNLDLVRK